MGVLAPTPQVFILIWRVQGSSIGCSQWVLVLSVGCGYLGLDDTLSSFWPTNLRGFGESECSWHFYGLLVASISTLGPWTHPLGSPKCFSTLCVPTPFFLRLMLVRT